MRSRALRWVPAAAWALVLLVLGRQEAAKLPAGGIWGLPGIDKAAHFVAYGVLGLLIALAARTRPVLVAVLAALAVGAIDERGQAAVAGRFSDWRDLLADLLGAAAGAWIAHRTLRRPARSS